VGTGKNQRADKQQLFSSALPFSRIFIEYGMHVHLSVDICETLTKVMIVKREEKEEE